MPRAHVKRLRICGWNIPKTLFLVFPYRTTTGPILVGRAYDYKKIVYFRFFGATDGIIEHLTDEEITIVVDHEKEEIRRTEKEENLGFISLEAERQRHEPELPKLANVARKISSIAQAKPLVPGSIFSFWISFFLTERFDQFANYGIRMPEFMLKTEYREGFRKILNEVWRLYGHRNEAVTKSIINLIMATHGK
jgi:hypothetical protein